MRIANENLKAIEADLEATLQAIADCQAQLGPNRVSPPRPPSSSSAATKSLAASSVFKRFPVPKYASMLPGPAGETYKVAGDHKAPRPVADYVNNVLSAAKLVDKDVVYLMQSESEFMQLFQDGSASVLDADPRRSAFGVEGEPMPAQDAFTSELVDLAVSPFLRYHVETSHPARRVTDSRFALPRAVDVCMRWAEVSVSVENRIAARAVLAVMQHELAANLETMARLSRVRRIVSDIRAKYAESKVIVALCVYLNCEIEARLCRLPRVHIMHRGLLASRVAPDYLFDVVIPELLAARVLVERTGRRKILREKDATRGMEVYDEPYWEFNFMGIAVHCLHAFRAMRDRSCLQQQPEAILRGISAVETYVSFGTFDPPASAANALLAAQEEAVRCAAKAQRLVDLHRSMATTAAAAKPRPQQDAKNLSREENESGSEEDDEGGVEVVLHSLAVDSHALSLS